MVKLKSQMFCSNWQHKLGHQGSPKQSTLKFIQLGHLINQSTRVTKTINLKIVKVQQLRTNKGLWTSPVPQSNGCTHHNKNEPYSSKEKMWDIYNCGTIMKP